MLISPSTAASAVNCVAVIANADGVPVCVIEVILLLLACSASKFVAMFALLSETVIDVTCVLATTAAVPAAVTALTAKV